jgi:predicted site-specific integrase-resolvase
MASGKRVPPTPAEIDEWMTGAEVAAAGVTPRTLSRWAEGGVVTKAKDSVGQWRFNPVEVEAARGTTRPSSSSGQRDEVLEVLRATLAMMQGFVTASFSLVHEPGLKLLELMSKNNDALAARCATLEDRHLKFLETFETLMTAQHERELATTVLTQQEARRDMAFKKLTDAAPGMFSQVLATLAGKSLLHGIDDEQLQVLLMAEFLKPEQRAILTAEQNRREAIKAKAGASSAAEPTPAPNGATTEDKKA